MEWIDEGENIRSEEFISWTRMRNKLVAEQLETELEVTNAFTADQIYMWKVAFRAMAVWDKEGDRASFDAAKHWEELYKNTDITEADRAALGPFLQSMIAARDDPTTFKMLMRLFPSQPSFIGGHDMSSTSVWKDPEVWSSFREGLWQERIIGALCDTRLTTELFEATGLPVPADLPPAVVLAERYESEAGLDKQWEDIEREFLTLDVRLEQPESDGYTISVEWYENIKAQGDSYVFVNEAEKAKFNEIEANTKPIFEQSTFAERFWLGHPKLPDPEARPAPGIDNRNAYQYPDFPPRTFHPKGYEPGGDMPKFRLKTTHYDKYYDLKKVDRLLGVRKPYASWMRWPGWRTGLIFSIGFIMWDSSRGDDSFKALFTHGHHGEYNPREHLWTGPLKYNESGVRVTDNLVTSGAENAKGHTLGSAFESD